MQVQVLLAERLDDRRTITELRKAAHTHAAGQAARWALIGEPSTTNAASQTRPSGKSDEATDVGCRTDDGAYMKLQVQCEALSIKCQELETLNSDMSTFVQTLNTALEDQAREIDGLKQDRKLSFAVGRLPGHLPGCRSCAARDALIADLRKDELDQAKCNEERKRAQKLLEESKARCDDLQRELTEWREKAERMGKQLLENESALTSRNQVSTSLQDEADAARKALSDSEERLAAENTRVKELQGKVRSLENDFAAIQVLLNAKNAEIAELESMIEKQKQDARFERQLSAMSEELNKERCDHLELKRQVLKSDEDLRQKDGELREAREQLLKMGNHAEVLAADVERLCASLQVEHFRRFLACDHTRRMQFGTCLDCMLKA